MFNGFPIDWGCFEVLTELSHLLIPDLSRLCLWNACCLCLKNLQKNVSWLVANINKWIVQRIESFSCWVWERTVDFTSVSHVTGRVWLHCKIAEWFGVAATLCNFVFVSIWFESRTNTGYPGLCLPVDPKQNPGKYVSYVATPSSQSLPINP